MTERKFDTLAEALKACEHLALDVQASRDNKARKLRLGPCEVGTLTGDFGNVENGPFFVRIYPGHGWLNVQLEQGLWPKCA